MYHTHDEKTLEVCSDPLCKKGGFVLREVCCLRFDKEVVNARQAVTPKKPSTFRRLLARLGGHRDPEGA